MSGVLMGGGGSGSPFPFLWEVVRAHIDPVLALNPTGDASGDGPASLAIDAASGTPHVVWARNDGSGHDIVLSSWNGGSWTPAESITDDAIDDLDPWLDVDDSGRQHVAWWTPGSPARVWYVERPPGEAWTTPVPVSDPAEQAARPTVARFDGETWVSYQRAGAGGVTELVVARTPGAWAREVLATTSYAGPAADGDLDVQIHRRGAHLWVDWVAGDGLLAWRAWDPASGAWSAAETLAYSWTPEQGEPIARETARTRIRLEVTASSR